MNDAFEVWAVLELMGHVKLAGKVTEEERFGSKMGRIDIPGIVPCGLLDSESHKIAPDACPQCAGTGTVERFSTQYFSGSSIYRLTPVTEEVARAVAANHKPQPISPWELPRALTHQAIGSAEYRDGYQHDDGE